MTSVTSRAVTVRFGGLTAVDEVDPRDGLGGVVTVTSGRAFGWWEEPLVFVEPESLRRRAGRLGELPYPHLRPSPFRVSLDLPPCWKVHHDCISRIS